MSIAQVRSIARRVAPVISLTPHGQPAFGLMPPIRRSHCNLLLMRDYCCRNHGTETTSSFVAPVHKAVAFSRSLVAPHRARISDHVGVTNGQTSGAGPAGARATTRGARTCPTRTNRESAAPAHRSTTLRPGPRLAHDLRFHGSLVSTRRPDPPTPPYLSACSRDPAGTHLDQPGRKWRPFRSRPSPPDRR
jgi:hypothetical protein